MDAHGPFEGCPGLPPAIPPLSHLHILVVQHAVNSPKQPIRVHLYGGYMLATVLGDLMGIPGRP